MKKQSSPSARESVAYLLRAYQEKIEEQDRMIAALRSIVKRIMRFSFYLSAVVTAGLFCVVMSLLTR